MTKAAVTPQDKLEAAVTAVMGRHGYATAGANGTVAELLGAAREYAEETHAGALRQLAESVAELVTLAREHLGEPAEPARRAKRGT